MSTRENILTITEFAKKVGYTREYVSKLISKGKLKPRKTITGKKYFLEEDVTLFWNNGEKNGKQ